MNSILSNTSETNSVPFTDTFRSTDVTYDGGEDCCAVVESLLLDRWRIVIREWQSSVMMLWLSLAELGGFDLLVRMGVLAALIVNDSLAWSWE